MAGFVAGRARSLPSLPRNFESRRTDSERKNRPTRRCCSPRLTYGTSTAQTEPYWNHGFLQPTAHLTKKPRFRGASSHSGGGIRTRDLRVMRPSGRLRLFAAGPRSALNGHIARDGRPLVCGCFRAFSWFFLDPRPGATLGQCVLCNAGSVHGWVRPRRGWSATPTTGSSQV